VLGCCSLMWVVTWAIYFRDNPADHAGITPAELAELPNQGVRPSAASQRHRVPWLPLTLRMLPVTVVYFCYGWTLWLYLSWLPSFFLNEYKLDIRQSALFASAVFFAGVGGDLLGGVLSDRIFERTGDLRLARRNVVMAGLLGAFVCLIPMFITRDLTLITISLAAGFFFAEVVIGPMWAIPMDIAPKYSGTASGLMNTGSAAAAILSPLAFGYIADVTGNWHLPFAGSLALLLTGALLAPFMRPERPFTA
jgi:MFS family permease